jgi:hypothetical protein
MSFPNCHAEHWAFAAVLDPDRFAPGPIGEILPWHRAVSPATTMNLALLGVFCPVCDLDGLS